MGKTKSTLTTLLRWWFILPIVYGVLIILCVFDVIEHEETTTTRVLCVLGCLALFVAQVVYLLVALFRRKWWLSLGVFLGLCVNAVLTVFCIVALAAGQYRPPKQYDEDAILDSLVLDSIEALYTEEAVEEIDSTN